MSAGLLISQLQTPAAAATPWIEMPVCRPRWLDEQTLGEQLLVETSSRGVARVIFRVPDCDLSSLLELEVLLMEPPSRGLRKLNLGDVPESARVRSLALAVGELIESTRTKPQKVITKSPEDSENLDADLDSGWSAVLGPWALSNPYDGNFLVGGHFGLAFRGRPTWMFELGIASGGSTDAVGSVSFGEGSARLSALWELDARFFLGGYLEAGLAWSVGQAVAPNTDASGTTPLLMAGGRFGAQLELFSGWPVATSLDLGAVLAGFRATSDGEVVAALRGVTLGASVWLAPEL